MNLWPLVKKILKIFQIVVSKAPYLSGTQTRAKDDLVLLQFM